MKYTRTETPEEHEYTQECENCGELSRVFTQSDNYPEYYTEVWVECRKCHAWISFDLPVN